MIALVDVKLDSVEEDEALERFMSIHGATRSVDELIDDILNGKDSKKKRRFSTG